MKKTLISLTLLALAGVAAGGYWMLREPPPQWTTDSPEALAEFQRGFDAESKIYRAEAKEHFVRAAELDPDFLIAKLHQAMYEEKPERERLRAELAAADRGRLNSQERFLLDHWLARTAPDTPEREPAEILDAFLAENPDNFHGLRYRCEGHWQAQDWDPAESCYQRLLELHPNWVRAQNFLGYIAMARGRFSEAEERFSTYRYIAPDQANPHDSMAELLITLGRYEEAEASLRKAIGIKPDFCHAYELRAQIGLFTSRFDIVEKALEDHGSFEACKRTVEYGYSCMMSASVRYYGGDAEGAWEAIDGDCLERRQGVDLTAHRVAVMTGRTDRALEMEDLLGQRREQALEESRPDDTQYYDASLAHMEGIRALAGGNTARAVELLSKADKLLGYLGGERAAFKLFHRLDLLHALELAGEKAAAEALRRKIEAVNPRLLQDVQLRDLDQLTAG
ncbi:MAG: tetratricopeptide repeat protein [Thermoanaerobaculia bacterium]